mgnify:CR=1 FL=1
MAITNDKTMKIVNNSYYLYVAFMLLDFIHEICVILKITEPSLSAGFAAKRVVMTAALVVMWCCFRSLLDESERFLRNSSMLLIIGRIASLATWYWSVATTNKWFDNGADPTYDFPVYILYSTLAMVVMIISLVIGIRLYRHYHGEMRRLGVALTLSFAVNLAINIAQSLYVMVAGADSTFVTVNGIITSVGNTVFLLYVAYTLRKACIWLQSR